MAQAVLMSYPVQRVRAAGRPPIGPKAQAAVPKEIWDHIDEEAKRRKVPRADVWRELILEHGYPAWLAAKDEA